VLFTYIVARRPFPHQLECYLRVPLRLPLALPPVLPLELLFIVTDLASSSCFGSSLIGVSAPVIGSSCDGGGVLDFGGFDAGDASGSSDGETGAVTAVAGSDGSTEPPGAAAGALPIGAG
jgi:hypothetical protein